MSTEGQGASQGQGATAGGGVNDNEGGETFDAEAVTHFWQNSLQESAKLVHDYMEKQAPELRRMIDPFNLSPSLVELSKSLMSNPVGFLEQQKKFAEGYLALIDQQIKAYQGEETTPVISPSPRDKRFAGDAWAKPGPFDFMKQTYLLAADAIQGAVATATGLEPQDHHKLQFFAKQFIDAISPSNYLMTNPMALMKTVEEGGQNLKRGTEFLLDDLKRGKGVPLVKMVDDTAFKVGENIAVTPGEVVFKNRFFELIQYTPTTEKVHKVPLVIFPPWINKYYILDLTEKKSFVKWATDQGFQVFIVSWVNPDGSYREVGFDDYLKEAYLEAISVAREITGAPSVNTIGYCVAGTFLTAVLAYMEAKGIADQVSSATFFTAQVDFEDAGDLSLFVDDAQLENIEALAEEKGYLDKRYMALTFNMLRSNDLIWSYVVNNYLMGKEPMAFDLLYWNCDSTNLPHKMHVAYLTNMYRDNKLVEAGGITLDGVPIDITTIKTPIFLQAGREDHIAPVSSVWKLTKKVSGPVEFMMAGSGHIAGVVNPPAAKKYQYWTGDSNAKDLDSFIAGAKETPGSWWPHWAEWLKGYSGDEVKAKKPGSRKHKALYPAPGQYVLMSGDEGAD